MRTFFAGVALVVGCAACAGPEALTGLPSTSTTAQVVPTPYGSLTICFAWLETCPPNPPGVVEIP